jgi:hypothetical protein
MPIKSNRYRGNIRDNKIYKAPPLTQSEAYRAGKDGTYCKRVDVRNIQIMSYNLVIPAILFG